MLILQSYSTHCFVFTSFVSLCLTLPLLVENLSNTLKIKILEEFYGQL